MRCWPVRGEVTLLVSEVMSDEIDAALGAQPERARNMKIKTGEKSFDVMKWLRETRACIYEETKNKTFEETALVRPQTDRRLPGKAAGSSKAAPRWTDAGGAERYDRARGAFAASQHRKAPGLPRHTGKRFDCVKWTREIRGRNYKKKAAMSPEERRRFFEDGRPTDPVLAKLFDRRKPPRADAPPSERPALDEPRLDPATHRTGKKRR